MLPLWLWAAVRPASEYAALCPFPAADVRDAPGAITELRTVLQALVDQIALTEPVDEEGRSLLMNAAYVHAVALLKALAAENGGGKENLTV